MIEDNEISCRELGPMNRTFVINRAGHTEIWQSVNLAALLSFILSLYFLIIQYINIGSSNDRQLSILLSCGHILATISYAWLTYRFVKKSPILLLTPAAGYILCCSVFFGFGGLATIMADDLTLALMARDAYIIDYASQIRADVAIFSGSTLLLLAMNVGRLPRPTEARLVARPSLRKLATTAVLVGLLLKFSVLLPEAWGYIQWTVPGSLKSLSQLPDVGFLLMAIAIARGDRGLLGVFVALWLPHLAICLLEFSKTAVIFAMAMPAIGALIGGSTFIRVLPLILLAALLFAFSQNVNVTARNSILAFNGIENHAPISLRVEALSEAVNSAIYKDEEVQAYNQAPPQLWWVRLNYSGPLIRAMQLHDLGQPGRWNVPILQFLVPRIFWPDKPVLDNAGQTFNRIVTQNEKISGRVSITVFGEGYWIAGWPGLALFATLSGLILGLVMRQSLAWLDQRDYLYFPVALLAFNIGAVGILDFFQTSLLGATAMLIGLSIVTGLVARYVIRLF
ncbi:MAG: hypothetical protein ACKO0Z_04835 [Betaproteobacteria bacterium]